MPIESDIHPHIREERADLFTAPDLGSSEDETHEVLYALVRATKPELVLETGTFKGYATAALARGCWKNGFGKVITVDCEDSMRKELAERARGETFPMQEYVTFVHSDTVDFLRSWAGGVFGFAFLDSNSFSRVEELRILKERNLAPGLVVVHDTSRNRAASYPDDPEFPSRLDALGLLSVENPLSRGWRIFDLRPSPAFPRRTS